MLQTETERNFKSTPDMSKNSRQKNRFKGKHNLLRSATANETRTVAVWKFHIKLITLSFHSSEKSYVEEVKTIEVQLICEGDI